MEHSKVQTGQPRGNTTTPSIKRVIADVARVRETMEKSNQYTRGLLALAEHTHG